jgi:hypothetical protein
MLAARLLGREEPRPISGLVRERSLDTIERALAARRSPRLRDPRWAAVAAAAAAAVVWSAVEGLHAVRSKRASNQVAVVASPLGQGARFLDSATEVELVPELSLRVGVSVVTVAGGGARLELSTGTRLELESASTLTLRNQDQLQRFDLREGVLDAHIAKLGASERFVVDTPDAEVEVRGTVFRLHVLPAPEACGEGSRTRLEVDDGIVEVRAAGRSERISAGQRWPLDCAAGADTPRVTPPPVPRDMDRLAPGAERARAPVERAIGSASNAHAERRSALAVQSDLFAQGVRAQREGDTGAALSAYASLLQRYPASPLAENALVERMRLLASKPTEARREAARYLARYPKGFARAEAERLMAGQ